MPLILGANSASGGYNVANSLRFNSGSSDFLNKTFGTATNRKIFTISLWTKRSKLCDPLVGASAISIFSGGISNSAQTTLEFNNEDRFSFFDIASPYSTYNFILRSNAFLRDISAWYHLVVAFDSTQATASNRIKLYLNGSQVTSLSSSDYPTLNYEPNMNNNIVHRIGNTLDNTFLDRFYNGYLSEFNFIDGQALTPSSFGETNTLSGIWIPKAYTGTYGTNGFYQKYANSAALGTDSSGNGNTFTVNNLTSVDQSTDTPTNNFCTLNPLFPQNDSLAFTNGNLQAVKPSGSATGSYYGNFGVSAGKWYWEMKCTATGGADQWIGIGQMRTLAPSGYPGNDAYCIAAGHTNAALRYNGTNVGTYTMASWTAGDIIMMALDMDNSKVYWGKNGTWQNSGNPAAGTGSYTNSTIFDGNFINPVGSLYQSGGDVSYNFGSPSYSANSYTDGAGYGNFSYAVPSGFYALNTKNLATYG